MTIWVPGIPRPKGSVTPNRGGKTVRPAQAQTTDWQRTVALFVKRYLRERLAPGWDLGPGYDGPVHFSGAFLFARPEGDESAYPMGKAYDGDKLMRCVADALSACGSRGSSACRPGCRKHGGLLTDDDRIVSWGQFDVLWAAPLIEVTSIGSPVREYLPGQPSEAGAYLEVRAK